MVYGHNSRFKDTYGKSRQEGKVRSTNYRRPLRLVYYEACLSEADARRRERYLKGGKGKHYLQQRLSAWIAGSRQ